MIYPEELSSTVRRVQDEIEAIRGRGTADGIVMTVTPTGQIIDVDIPVSSYSLSPRELASRLIAAHTAAQGDADEQARSARSVLADDPRIRRIMAAAHTPDPEPRRRPEPRYDGGPRLHPGFENRW